MFLLSLVFISYADALEGYDKIKLLNDYFYILEHYVFNDPSDTVKERITNNNDILHTQYLFNRHNNRCSEVCMFNLHRRNLLNFRICVCSMDVVNNLYSCIILANCLILYVETYISFTIEMSISRQDPWLNELRLVFSNISM